MQIANSMKRDSRFDLVRATAIFIIVLSHFCSNMLGGVPGFFVLGSVGNAMFFMLSGLLLGLQWQKLDRVGFNASFIARRVVRIAPAYLTFVMIYLVLLYLAGGVDVKSMTIFANILMLGWFSELTGATHLWFMTALVIFYLLLFLLSRQSKRTFWTVSSVAVGVQGIMVVCGIPRAFSIGLFWAGCVCFLWSESIVRWISRIRKKKLVVLVAILAFSLFDFMDVFHLFGSSMVVRYWLSVSVGAAVVAALMCFRFESKIVGSLSLFSFEWYLVHYPFCAGPLCVQRWFGNSWLANVAFWLGSLIAAIVLHYVIKLKPLRAVRMGHVQKK